jgi:hypothetical protein
MAYWNVLSHDSSQGTELNDEQPQSGQKLTLLRNEKGTAQILVGSFTATQICSVQPQVVIPSRHGQICMCCLSLARWIQSMLSNPISLRSVLIVSFHLRLDVTSGLFPSDCAEFPRHNNLRKKKLLIGKNIKRNTELNVWTPKWGNQNPVIESAVTNNGTLKLCHFLDSNEGLEIIQFKKKLFSFWCAS